MGHGKGQMNLAAVCLGRDDSPNWPKAFRGWAPSAIKVGLQYYPTSSCLWLQLRSRAEEVKRSIERMIQALQFAADRLQW